MINSHQRGFIFSGVANWIVYVFLLFLFWKIVFLGFLGAIFGGVPGGHNKLDADPHAGGVVIGFFNGVLTLPSEAKSHLGNLRSRFGDKTPSGKPLQYQLFYNDSYGLTLDLIETFDQRAAQIGLGDRYDFFWGLISGDQVGATKAAINVSGAAEVVDSIASLFTADTIEYIRALPKNKQIITSAEHRRIIEQLTGKKSKQGLVLVAHSQGNLYATFAFNHASKRSKAVSVIHAAPPMDILNGEYALSDGDKVINGLRKITDHVPAANITSDTKSGSALDLGHGFAEVYFNPNTGAGHKVERDIRAVLEAQK